jgi:hypothetical protein
MGTNPQTVEVPEREPEKIETAKEAQPEIRPAKRPRFSITLQGGVPV